MSTLNTGASDALSADTINPQVAHPLDPLTALEIQAAADIARTEMSELGDAIRFEIIELAEPAKSVVRSFVTGDAIAREARVNVFSQQSIGVWRLRVSISEGRVLERAHVADARPMIQLEEFLAIEALVKRDARFIEACTRRGITDMSLVCVDPWSAGNFGNEDEAGRHISHAFCWLRTRREDNLYAHPIEGLNPVVDIKRMELIRIDDRGAVPIPMREYNYDVKSAPQNRDDLRPIDISQPDGVSFRMAGNRIEWHEWSALIGFNARESLTLHDVRYGGRPVLYRASLAEMVVPYGSPENGHYRKNVFDIGEYGLGKLVNPLKLGCDCLGVIKYLDYWIADIGGNPMCMENAVCIHEEDDGIMWKHYDFRLDQTEVRRSRRLVISSIATVGNYEYACYWYLYLDGTIEYEIKATGIINTAACIPGDPGKYGTEVAPGVVGQIHQHQFCARLDLAIDGDKNSVMECDTVAEPLGPDNPYGNAFYLRETLVDAEGGRSRNADSERFWKFINPNKRNAMNQPTAYKLHPDCSVRPFVHPDSPSGTRMPFANKQLWLTQYDAEERFPGGEFMNHCDGNDGVHVYATKGRSIASNDVVAWHVFGLHHLPRTEDFPVQPVAKTGFKLVPTGFFDSNPTLDLPASANLASTCAEKV
ncbi:MAG: primary-amine oxidase [Chromatiales bacterium]|nr:primary-amine oxidase [Chromatiales bacterium]